MLQVSGKYSGMLITIWLLLPPPPHTLLKHFEQEIIPPQTLKFAAGGRKKGNEGSRRLRLAGKCQIPAEAASDTA